MNRNPKALLSPREVHALRALKQEPGRPISTEERLLLSMGLAVSDGEVVHLSDAGRVRLEIKERANQ